jgi:hypothetical protein
MKKKNFASIVTLILILLFINPSSGQRKSVGKAMLFCLLPGGGQFYTERYLPGVLIGTGEITLGYFAYKNHIEKKYTERNSFLWWGLFLFGYSLADAYVGAKMYGFDAETDINKVSLTYKIKF